MERRKSDIDINDNSWRVINGSECSLWWFLDEYDIKALIDFKNSVDEEVILSNILREYL